MSLSNNKEDFLALQWSLIEEHYNNGQLLTANVVEVNEKGLIVDVGGIRGLVLGKFHFFSIEPQNQTNLAEKNQPAAESSSSMIGQNPQLKVVEVDRTRKHLILSQDILTIEDRQKLYLHRNQLLRELQPGDVRQGVIKSVTQLAVSVDIEGLEGWISRGQLSWNEVLHPQEFVHVGERVDVMILKVDGSNIALSMKYAQQSDEILRYVQPEDTRRGRVFALADFGAFVDLGGVCGLIPISQLMEEYIKHPSDLLHIGQEIDVKVMNVDREKKSITLSTIKFNNER